MIVSRGIGRLEFGDKDSPGFVDPASAGSEYSTGPVGRRAELQCSQRERDRLKAEHSMGGVHIRSMVDMNATDWMPA